MWNMKDFESVIEGSAAQTHESPFQAEREALLGLSPRALAERFKTVEAEDNLPAFIDFLVNDDALLANVSWWEKWLTNGQVKLFEAAIKERKLREAEKLKTDVLPLGLEKKFTPEELHAIFSNIGAVQLTYGCSMACKLCGFDALPGAREHISFKQVRSLLEQFGNQFPRENQGKHDAFFYYASDPWDYKSEEDGEKRDFKDVYLLAKEFTGISSGIRSRKVTDTDWINTLGDLRAEGSSPVQISTLGLSKENIKKLQEKLKGSKAIHIQEGGMSEDGVRGIGRDSLGSQDSMGKGGIGCFDGMLLTPRGIYSSVQLPISEQYPQGMVMVPFERCDITQVKVGMRIEEALRYVIPINRGIKESQTNYDEEKITYKNGLSEFEVCIGERNIYLRVDGNFVVTEINSQGIETEIQKYFQGIEKEIQALENFEYSDDDMNFLCSKYLGSDDPILFPRAPGRKAEDFPIEDVEKYRKLNGNSRYSHSNEQWKIYDRVRVVCGEYRKRKKYKHS